MTRQPGAPATATARQRIVDVAARLLHEQGPAAVTTRGVAEAAGLQAPAIYRLFGDKDGLLDAVAEHVMAQFVATKATDVLNKSNSEADALEELRAGWDAQVEFALVHPEIFRLLSAPDRVRRSPAAAAGRVVLEHRLLRLAATGRLRASEQRASLLLQAACLGVVQTLLSTPVDRRDPGLADAMFDAVLTQILTDKPSPANDGPVAIANALRAVSPQLTVLSRAEQNLLTDWLDRIVAAPSSL